MGREGNAEGVRRDRRLRSAHDQMSSATRHDIMWTVARDYEPLTRYLKGRSEPVIELTFTELDRLVEGGLPGSARRYQAWWANSRVSQRHSTYWLDAGRQAAPDFNAGRVRFTFGGEVRHGPNLRTLGRGGAKASRSSVGAGRGGQVTRRLGSAASLSPTGEVTQAVVRVGWLDGGAVSIEGGKPMTAGLPAEPGLYRFSFLGRDGAVDAVYVGETDNWPAGWASTATPVPVNRPTSDSVTSSSTTSGRAVRSHSSSPPKSTSTATLPTSTSARCVSWPRTPP